MILRLLVTLLSIFMPTDQAEEYLYFLTFGGFGALLNSVNGRAFLLQIAPDGAVTASPSAYNALLNLVLAGLVGLIFKLAYDFLRIAMLRRLSRAADAAAEIAEELAESTNPKTPTDQ